MVPPWYNNEQRHWRNHLRRKYQTISSMLLSTLYQEWVQYTIKAYEIKNIVAKYGNHYYLSAYSKSNFFSLLQKMKM